MDRERLEEVRAVYFDAVGTLIRPCPPPATVYAAVGQRHGSRLGRTAIGPRFVAAWKREDALDQAAGWTTSEARERERWRRIVAAVLDDVTDFEACFAELYDHFRQPAAWRCDPDAGPVLTELVRRGCKVGLASNNDGRLRQVLAGMPELAPLQAVHLSSEIGWRKPAPQFFAAVCRQAGLRPAQVLYLGDDPISDGEGAAGAGMHSLLIDTSRAAVAEGKDCIGRLTELLEISANFSWI